jgi:hypothetical protein
MLSCIRRAEPADAPAVAKAATTFPQRFAKEGFDQTLVDEAATVAGLVARWPVERPCCTILAPVRSSRPWAGGLLHSNQWAPTAAPS